MIPSNERSQVEILKENSRSLRGQIVEEIALETPSFAKQTVHILKFHGAYQQSDRDARKQGDAQYSSMVRVSVPGGILTPAQYLTLDRLAGEFGDGSLRATTRQDIQFYRVGKTNLRALISALNEGLLTTLAACGDVVRNVVCCPAPYRDGRRNGLESYVRELSQRFKPKTRGYYEIWVDGEKSVAAESAGDPEPLYGATYLPRKFKIGFAAPGDNCIDVYTNDVGIVPVYGDGGLEAFTIVVGGGLAMSVGAKGTHPRLADPLATISPEDLTSVAEAIITIHRDFGNRANRKFARLKYVVEEWGLERFRAEVERRVGKPFPAARPLAWSNGQDHLGWRPQGDGSWFLGLPVASGRIADRGRTTLRTYLRELVERFQPGVRLTSHQNVLLTDIAPEARAEIEAALRAHGAPLAAELPPIVQHALACPALPTCGLAITEAERILPDLTAEIQSALDRAGLGRQNISLRVTGCPNGCARPYTAEIGIVGLSVNMYGIWLGASPFGTRLGFQFAVNLPRPRIVETLEPVFDLFRENRRDGEAFGDFCHRIGLEALRSATQAAPQ